MVVFLGLWIEKEAEEKNERGGWPLFEPYKRLEELGWWVLMVGIALEIFTSYGIAAKEVWDQLQINRNVAKNSPLNQPIKSIKADVFLLIRGTNFIDGQLEGPPQFVKRGANLIVFRDNETLTTLSCAEFETGLEMYFNSPGPITSTPVFSGPASYNAREYKMSFSWPSADFDLAMGYQGWIDKNNASINDLDKKPFSVCVCVPGINDGPNTQYALIPNGFAVNISSKYFVRGKGDDTTLRNFEIIKRQFSMPRYPVWGGRVICAPLQTNSP
jgi:hypothetical protein